MLGVVLNSSGSSNNCIRKTIHVNRIHCCCPFRFLHVNRIHYWCPFRFFRYFQDILQKDRSSTKIKFHSNGTWSPVLSSEPEEPAPEIPKNIPVSKRKFSQVDEVIVIDLEDEDPVTRKGPRNLQLFY